MNTKTIQYILSTVLSVFTVVFLWGYFELGILALGINMTIFGIIFSSLYLSLIENKKAFLLKYKYWIIPFSIIIFSYSIYEIPFLKGINIWLLPLLVLFFFGYSIVDKENNHQWYLGLIPKLIFREFPVQKSIQELNRHMDTGNGKNNVLYKKIFLGVFTLIIINIFIIGLLMVADTNFKNFIWEFGKYINLTTILKIFISLILFIFFISLLGLWKIDTIIKAREDKSQIDSVICGIVLAGTLFTYILFIIIQIDSLFFQEVIDVKQIASLAKNGFWQLFLVSLINIVFFFVYYKKTHNYIQKLLGIFVFASLIILFSAVERMFSYISVYGLSYEKFFSSYTIIFFGILFVFMIGLILFNKKNDILKSTIITALWMYSFLHILPTEAFIFQINSKILQQQDSKIQKYQSHMLSIDILNDVNQIRGKKLFIDEDWQEWIDKKIEKSNQKKWYEKNFQNFRIQEKNK